MSESERWIRARSYLHGEHFLDDFEVSSDGQIRQNKKGVWGLREQYHKGNEGYYRLTFRTKKIDSHKLIKESFHGPTPEGMCVDHRNGDKKDNRLENLKFVPKRVNSSKGNLTEEQYAAREASKLLALVEKARMYRQKAANIEHTITGFV
jgi:hypothetical protein